MIRKPLENLPAHFLLPVGVCALGDTRFQRPSALLLKHNLGPFTRISVRVLCSAGLQTLQKAALEYGTREALPATTRVYLGN